MSGSDPARGMPPPRSDESDEEEVETPARGEAALQARARCRMFWHITSMCTGRDKEAKVGSGCCHFAVGDEEGA